MRKLFIFALILGFFNVLPTNINTSVQAEEKPKLAIVIDDFGSDRHGVEEMLNLKIPLTVAVLPGCEFTAEDAHKAHEHGHEVILHMPMENQTYMPESYYGPVLIKNTFSPQEAQKTINEAIDQIPNCKGLNIHMGTGVSRNSKLITVIMEEAKSKDLYFLDSRTIEGSVCDECAKNTGVKFYGRDVFLEPPGYPNYQTAVNQLLQKSFAV